jgi:regulator of replication initiation timing
MLIFALILAGCSQIVEPQCYTKQELKQMLDDHKEEMEEVATIVLANERLKKHMKEVERDNDVNVYSKNDKQFFAEEEWDKVEALFKKLKMTAIYRFGDTTIEFQFPMSEDGISNDLYYSTYSTELDNNDATKLCDHWWIIERAIDI